MMKRINLIRIVKKFLPLKNVRYQGHRCINSSSNSDYQITADEEPKDLTLIFTIGSLVNSYNIFHKSILQILNDNNNDNNNIYINNEENIKELYTEGLPFTGVVSKILNTKLRTDIILHTTNLTSIYLNNLKADSNNIKLNANVLNELTNLTNEKYKIVLCSNLPSSIVNQYITMFDINKFFISIVHATTIPVNKPNPGPILFAIESCQGDTAKSLMIGSTICDIKAAQSAGISTIMINNQLRLDVISKYYPEMIIDDFDITNAMLLLYDKSMY